MQTSTYIQRKSSWTVKIRLIVVNDIVCQRVSHQRNFHAFTYDHARMSILGKPLYQSQFFATFPFRADKQQHWRSNLCTASTPIRHYVSGITPDQRCILVIEPPCKTGQWSSKNDVTALYETALPEPPVSQPVPLCVTRLTGARTVSPDAIGFLWHSTKTRYATWVACADRAAGSSRRDKYRG